jgi:hypothetical protein
MSENRLRQVRPRQLARSKPPHERQVARRSQSNSPGRARHDTALAARRTLEPVRRANGNRIIREAHESRLVQALENSPSRQQHPSVIEPRNSRHGRRIVALSTALAARPAAGQPRHGRITGLSNNIPPLDRQLGRLSDRHPIPLGHWPRDQMVTTRRRRHRRRKPQNPEHQRNRPQAEPIRRREMDWESGHTTWALPALRRIQEPVRNHNFPRREFPSKH